MSTGLIVGSVVGGVIVLAILSNTANAAPAVPPKVPNTSDGTKSKDPSLSDVHQAAAGAACSKVGVPSSACQKAAQAVDKVVTKLPWYMVGKSLFGGSANPCNSGYHPDPGRNGRCIPNSQANTPIVFGK